MDAVSDSDCDKALLLPHICKNTVKMVAAVDP